MKLNAIANRTFWLVLGWLVVAMPARAFYDPSLGRWLNRDPIQERGGFNLFEFGRNNAVVYLDRFGLEPAIPLPDPLPPLRILPKPPTPPVIEPTPIPIGPVICIGTECAVFGGACIVIANILNCPPSPVTYPPPGPGSINAPPIRCKIPPSKCDFSHEGDGPTEDSKTCYYTCPPNGSQEKAYFPKGTKCPEKKEFPVTTLH